MSDIRIRSLIFLRCLAIFMACGLIITAHAQNNEQTFDAANRLYEQGRFADAAATYGKISASGQYSAALLFNSGNAFYKQGQMGRAIAEFRKAQLIAPHDQSIQKNLTIARTKARGGAVYVTPLWHRVVSVFNLNVWTLLLAACVWAVLILLALGFFNPNLRTRTRPYMSLCVVATILFGTGFLIKYLEETKAAAIVTAGETDVRNGPLDEAPSVFKVRDGTELEVLDYKDDWFQVSDTTDRMGWIRKDQVIIFRAADGLGHGNGG
jgi:tetratricopeptide (TPR) repeat protein